MISVQESVRQTHTLLAQAAAPRACPARLGPALQRGRCERASCSVRILNYRRPSRGVDDSQTRGRWPSDVRIEMARTVTEWFSEDIAGREFLRFEERTNYPLTLSVDDFGEGFRLVAQVQSPIDPQRICDYMHTALEQLVGALESAPTAPLRSLERPARCRAPPAAGGVERHAGRYPGEALMHQLFEAQVERAPERTALRFGATALSYAELDSARQPHGAGAAFARRGPRPTRRPVRRAGRGHAGRGAGHSQGRCRLRAARSRRSRRNACASWRRTRNSRCWCPPRPWRSPSVCPASANCCWTPTRLTLASQSDQRLTPDAALDARPRIRPTSSTPRAPPASPRAWWCRTVRSSTSSPAWRASPALTADDVLVAVTTLSFDIAVLELQLPLTLGATVVIASRDEAIDGHALERSP